MTMRWIDRDPSHIREEFSPLVDDAERPPDDNAHGDESVDKQRGQDLTDATPRFGIVRVKPSDFFAGKERFAGTVRLQRWIGDFDFRTFECAC